MSLQENGKSIRPDSLSPRKNTLSGNRSPWMTPTGRSFGQRASRWSSSRAMKSRRPACTLSARSAARSNSGRQPETDSGLARNSGKSRPARCIFASASPTPAQCAAFGRRGHMPSRKLMIAAGRSGERRIDRAAAVLRRLRAAHAVLGEMRHQRQEVRQVVLRHALLIEREDVGALAGVHQEVGILDALGDALVGAAIRRCRNF